MNYLKKHKAEMLKRYGKEPTTLEELATAIIATITNDQNRVVGFAWDISYRDKVSNTHSCPVAGPTNFVSKPDKPKGYPGFSGQVWIRYENSPYPSASDTFGPTLTHTGTGGAGSYNGPWKRISFLHYHNKKKNSKFLYYRSNPVECYSWDYRFYLSDFPLLEEVIEETRTLYILKGRPFVLSHQFKWEDPETKAADEAFMMNAAFISLMRLKYEHL